MSKSENLACEIGQPNESAASSSRCRDSQVSRIEFERIEAISEMTDKMAIKKGAPLEISDRKTAKVPMMKTIKRNSKATFHHFSADALRVLSTALGL